MEEKKDLDYDYVKLVYGVDLTPEENKEGAPAPKPPEEPKKDTSKMELYDWIQCIVAAILCGILIFLFIGRIIGVDGSSMYPTLYDGDKVIVSNLFYKPKYGDIVVVKTEYFGEHPIVKRVIATEGQTVDIDFTTGEVTVDGTALDEPYINELTMSRYDFNGAVKVPEGHVFVMGDNRNASSDSRSNNVGLVDTRSIIGKVYAIVMPGAGEAGQDGRTWGRIGSAYKSFKR